MTKFTRHKQLLPLVLLTTFSTETIYFWLTGKSTVGGNSYPYSPDMDNYLSLIILAANYIVYLFARRQFKYILITTLILGFFNLVSFTALRETFSMSINGGSDGIGIQPVALYAIVLTYILNFKRFNNFILDKKST